MASYATVSQPKLWARWLPAASRPPKMCGLRTRPRTDVNPLRMELPSAGAYRLAAPGAITCLLNVQITWLSYWYRTAPHSMQSGVCATVGRPSVCLSHPAAARRCCMQACCCGSRKLYWAWHGRRLEFELGMDSNNGLLYNTLMRSGTATYTPILNVIFMQFSSS